MAGGPEERLADLSAAGWQPRRGGWGPRRRRAAARLAAALAILATLVLSACCPATGPQPTAFTARLSPLPQGEALARLPDGRQVTLTGLTRVPAGPVYVTGHLLTDGRVAVTSVRPLAEPPAPTD